MKNNFRYCLEYIYRNNIHRVITVYRYINGWIVRYCDNNSIELTKEDKV